MPSVIIKADTMTELEEAVKAYQEENPGTFVKHRYTETDGTYCAVVAWK